MKRARTNLRITQIEAAEIMGVTQATVSRWETGKGGEPALSEWQRLVEAAATRGVSAAELTGEVAA